MKRAWEVTICGIRSIVGATSAAKAKRIIQMSALDAGYRFDWTEIRAVREPKFDVWAQVNETNVPWDRKYLKGCEEPPDEEQ